MRSWLETPLPEHENGVCLLVGGPGTGKSALVSTLIQAAERRRLPILGIKADLLPASIDSLEDLRAHLGLHISVQQALTETGRDGTPCILVIDQLDAVCELVDQRSGRLNTLLSLIRETADIQGVRVLATIRPFELRHEARLRTLQAGARVVSLGAFSTDEVHRFLPKVVLPEKIDIDLRTPHALDLICQLIRAEGLAFAFPSSIGQLRERYWRASIDRLEGLEQTACSLAMLMHQQSSLWIPAADFPGQGDDVERLVEIGLLRKSANGELVGFRHQTMYDFAIAKDLLRAEALVRFIDKHADSLEVRPIVRSALLHARAVDRSVYHRLTREILNLPSLHLRLLTIDTLLEAESPDARERRLFTEAVEDPLTRPRALRGIVSP